MFTKMTHGGKVYQKHHFIIISRKNMLEGYIPGQLLFVHNITIPIKHNVDWESIRRKSK